MCVFQAARLCLVLVARASIVTTYAMDAQWAITKRRTESTAAVSNLFIIASVSAKRLKILFDKCYVKFVG